MKIVVTGTRGIPDIQGGVETHCEELFPLIAAHGHEVVILRRDCYISPGNVRDNFKGVRLIDIHTPRRKSLEAIVHTFRSVLRARKEKADIIHIHAIGPALLTPLAKLLGMRVVVTHHGPDYDRDKWGFLAKTMLRFGECMGALFADRIIVISRAIDNLLHSKYPGVRTSLIYNGVPEMEPVESISYISDLGLSSGKYIVAIGRFVKEKNFHHLIEAYAKADLNGIKLAIAGDADHPDDYSEELKRMASEAGVVLTGFIKGGKLREIMTHAALFVLPSSHEGLPISLLEAMSYGRDVLVSDIPANTLSELSEDDFFHVGDIEDLKCSLERKIAENRLYRKYDLSVYDWNHIAVQTINVYKEIQSK